MRQFDTNSQLQAKRWRPTATVAAAVVDVVLAHTRRSCSGQTERQNANETCLLGGYRSICPAKSGRVESA